MTGQQPETSDDAESDRPDSHLDDLDDGCGCAEVWEHLSERREQAREARADDAEADAEAEAEATAGSD